MADVRLTATNPEDSSVVPVACNEKGELKLEEIPSFDGNVDGDLTVSGSVEVGDIYSGGILVTENEIQLRCDTDKDAYVIYNGGTSVANQKIKFSTTGSATFAGGLAKIDKWGQIDVNTPTSSGYAFQSRILDGNTTCFIAGSGSATFAGGIKSGTDTELGYLQTAGSGGTYGFIFATETSNDFTVALNYKDKNSNQVAFIASDDSGNDKARIGWDGSATFADKKCGFTSAGELFVTVRGKKYKTISVANGIMSWEEMTLRDQVQERLDDATVQIDPNFGVQPETDTGTP